MQHTRRARAARDSPHPEPEASPSWARCAPGSRAFTKDYVRSQNHGAIEADAGDETFLQAAAQSRRRQRRRAAVNAGLPASFHSPMKHIECWRWRYRDPKTGRICRTMYVLSEEEAAKFPDAERIPATRILREIDETDFADTLPAIGCPQAE